MSFVAVHSCHCYQQSLVDKAVAACLDDIEAARLVQAGSRVLLKVNMVSARPPEHAVNTHPAVLKAVAKWFMKHKARVWVGDSSGGMGTGRAGGNTANAFIASGVAAAAEEVGAQIVNLDTAGAALVRGGQVFDPVLVAKPVLDADLVVNVPKLKTHSLTLFTGAVKNMFGAVPGAAKAEYHRRAPTIELFCQGLVDVYAATRPALNVMDAVVGMEGNGPSGGDIKQRGLLLASRDGVALDAAACELIGCPRDKVLTTVLAERRKLGSSNYQLASKVAPVPFRLPPSALAGAVAPRLSAAFVRFLAHRPVFDAATCINCNECVRSCPVEVLRPGQPTPQLHPGCIQCFCCHELCPVTAIKLVPVYPRIRRAMDWMLKRRRRRK